MIGKEEQLLELISQQNSRGNSWMEETRLFGKEEQLLELGSHQNSRGHSWMEETRFPEDGSMQPHDLGRMQHGCPHCDALHWQHEATSGSVGAGTASYGMCCMHGTAQLPALREAPQFLRDMLSGETAASKRFLENIRRYNAVF